MDRRQPRHRRPNLDQGRDPEATQKLEREILRYLLRYPDAKDTIQGIQRWWVEGGAVEFDMSNVEATVLSLVRRGFLNAKEIQPDGWLYSVEKTLLAAIEEYLERGTDEPWR